jgi:hypothetical protein
MQKSSELQPTSNMTPPKVPKQNVAQDRFNILFDKNCEEIKRHLHRQDAGADLGHNVTLELAFGYLLQAWRCALLGYAWRPGIALEPIEKNPLASR